MTVYIVQQPTRYDKETGNWVDAYDLSPAREYGETRFLFTPTATPWNPASWVPELHKALSRYSDDDYLLCTGNPILLGAAVAVASMYNQGRVRCLQWSGKDRRYLAVSANLSPLPL